MWLKNTGADPVHSQLSRLLWFFGSSFSFIVRVASIWLAVESVFHIFVLLSVVFFFLLRFSFLDQNKEKVQGSIINGVAPSISTIADSSYEVSRPLYFYIKQEHVGVIPGLQEFGDYFMSLATSESPLEDAGLIPKP